MESSERIQKVIDGMLQDNVITCHIRSDKMICTYEAASFARKGCEQTLHRYITQNMRELKRFVLAAKDIDKRGKGLKDICNAPKTELAIDAARRV